uniref:Uncharacterized protein n=1 Tax=viral metagenome TaxID=1070528 RepID=A0A6H1ZWZ9_9ZZZZ
MNFYKNGKDQEYQPCIELDDGSFHVAIELMVALMKALEKKGVLKQKDIKDEV